MNIRISERLRAIAELVPEQTRLVDVGTDHAMLPVWLVLQGRVTSCIASDIRSGPLRGAEKLIKKTGTDEKIRLCLADGLDGVSREDADTVVIAGMGGEAIASILEKTAWIMQDVYLILSPHSKSDVLRQTLFRNGIRISGEQLVKDHDKLYPIITACAGAVSEYSAAEWHTGKYEDIYQDPLFPELLTGLIKRAEKAAPFDARAAALLRDYISMNERLRSDVYDR